MFEKITKKNSIVISSILEKLKNNKYKKIKISEIEFNNFLNSLLQDN